MINIKVELTLSKIIKGFSNLCIIRKFPFLILRRYNWYFQIIKKL